MKAGRRTIAAAAILIVFGLAFWWALSLEGGNVGSSDGDRIVVATTIAPLSSIVEQITSGEVEVITLLPSGSSPHTFDPQPADVAKAQDADLVVAVGDGFDDWAITMIPDDVPIVHVVDVDDLLRASLPDELDGSENKNDAEDEHGHEHGVYDPHVWLSPENAKKIAIALAIDLADIDPDRHIIHEDRSDIFLGELQTLQDELHEDFQDVGPIRLITMHDGWRTFAQTFDLEIVGAVEAIPGKVPTPSELAQLEKLARVNNATHIVSEPQLSDSTVSSIATDVGLPLVVLDPIGGIGVDTYQDMMRNNVHALLEAK